MSRLLSEPNPDQHTCNNQLALHIVATSLHEGSIYAEIYDERLKDIIL